MKNLDKKTPMTDAERQAKRRHKLKMDSLNKDVIFITLNYLITKLESGEIDKDEFIGEIKNLGIPLTGVNTICCGELVFVHG